MTWHTLTNVGVILWTRYIYIWPTTTSPTWSCFPFQNGILILAICSHRANIGHQCPNTIIIVVQRMPPSSATRFPLLGTLTATETSLKYGKSQAKTKESRTPTTTIYLLCANLAQSKLALLPQWNYRLARMADVFNQNELVMIMW